MRCILLPIAALTLVASACGDSTEPISSAGVATTVTAAEATTLAPPDTAEVTTNPPADDESATTTTTATATTAPPAAEFTLESPVIGPGGPIPAEYTCFGTDESPFLGWGGAPVGTVSFALTVVDPDSDPPGFVHWVIYDMSADAEGMAGGMPPEPSLEDGTAQGVNDFGGIGYGGPCPPAEHTYVFTLYALDEILDLEPEATLKQLEAAMETHLLATAELRGSFDPP